MTKEATWSIFIALLALLFSDRDVQGQQSKKIVPLISTCSDVKQLLNVRDCRPPRMKYEDPKFDVVVDFSTDEDEWKVSKETVVYVTVIFHQLVRLRDYEVNFKDYAIRREGDVPEIMVYKNGKRGIELNVQTAIGAEPYVSSIFFYPSEENAKKFRRKPSR